MNNEEAIEYLKNYKYDNEVRQAIDTVLNYIEELENKLEIQTQNYHSAMKDINWFCGKRTGKTVETALILRKEILKLPEGRTYGIRRCKKNIICVIYLLRMTGRLWKKRRLLSRMIQTLIFLEIHFLPLLKQSMVVSGISLIRKLMWIRLRI